MCASYSGHSGHLFVLEDYFFYITRPMILIREQIYLLLRSCGAKVSSWSGHDKIESVTFARLSSVNASFRLIFTVTSGKQMLFTVAR